MVPDLSPSGGDWGHGKDQPMKNTTIALLAAAMLALASAPAAAEPRRSGVATPSQNTGAKVQPNRAANIPATAKKRAGQGMRPAGPINSAPAMAKKRTGKTGPGMEPAAPINDARKPGQR
jgi:hypothetical protein